MDLKQGVGEQRRALTVSGLRPKDKGRMGSIGRKVLLMKPIKAEKERGMIREYIPISGYQQEYQE
jgi:hypothetical protein